MQKMELSYALFISSIHLSYVLFQSEHAYMKNELQGALSSYKWPKL